jgi:hypothetical protein
MSPPRPLVAFGVGLVATGLSADPNVRGASPAASLGAAHPSPAPSSSASRPVPSNGLGDALGDAPPDVAVDLSPDGRGAHKVSLRRSGFLVSLRGADARAAGRDVATMRVAEPAGDDARSAALRLVWETTPRAPKGGSSPVTTRGFVDVLARAGIVVAKLYAARPPEPAGSFAGPHATCSAHHDGFGGFSALCAFPRGVRVSGVANVTGARALDDAWLVPGPSPLVRLDLARSPGGGEGRVIGLVHGAMGVVLRVEATFRPEEAPTLTVRAGERAQPAPP